MAIVDRAKLTQIVFNVLRERAVDFSDQIQLDTPLGAGGLAIDSIDCLEIILELEERTGIVLRAETLTGDALLTPASLIHYLDSLGREERE